MVNEVLLKIITFLHILFILFVVITPFTSRNYFLLLHSIVIPFLIFHWILNDNNCVITTVEKNIKEKMYGKVDENDCLTCKLITPIYDFKNNNKAFTKIIYSITILLFLISFGKLVYRYKTGYITNWKQLFI